MELPGKSLISGYHTGGEIDQRNAGAVWEAVGKAGDNLQELGVTGMKVAKDRREAAIPRAKVVAEAKETPEARDARVMAKIREVDDRYRASRLDSHYGNLAKEFEGKIAQNPDMTEQQVSEGWAKFTKPTRDLYEADDSSPLAARSREHYENGVGVMMRTAGVVKTVRAKNGGMESVSRAVKEGDEAGLEKGLAELKPFMTNEEHAAVRPLAYRDMRLTQFDRSIDGDPFAMRAELAKPDFLKSHPDFTRDDMDRLRSRTSAVARQSVVGVVDSFNKELPGDSLRSKEDVARVYGRSAPAHVVARMQEQFSRSHDPAEMRLRRTPDYQMQVSGEAGRMLDGLAMREDEDFENNYVSVAFTLARLDDSPGKSYQMEKLRSAAAGVVFRPKGREQSAFAELDKLIARENGKADAMAARMRTMAAGGGVAGHGDPGSPWEAGPHPEDEDVEISRQLDADARSGWLYDELSTYAGRFKNGLEDANDGDVERKLVDLHRELLGRTRDAENALPVTPAGSRPPGRDLLEVVGHFSSTRDASGPGVVAGGQLATQLAEARAKVDSAVSHSPIAFDEHERDALASFTQEQGEDRLRLLLGDGSRSKEYIADSMLRYRNKHGRRSQELSRRREAERSLFLLGYEQLA